jgi:hypothetical protein
MSIQLSLSVAWLFILLVIAPAISADPSSWIEHSQRKGITVYKSKSADSQVLSVRGDAEISASIQNILEVLKDNARASAWMPHVAEKREISYSDAQERIEYTHVDMPWPMQDRYFVNRGRLSREADGSVIVSVESVDAPDIVDQGRVRGWIHYSEFILRPISENQTHMSVQVNCDPNGAIPKWMVNIAQLDWPVDFLLGLQKELRHRGLLQEGSKPSKVNPHPFNAH